MMSNQITRIRERQVHLLKEAVANGKMEEFLHQLSRVPKRILDELDLLYDCIDELPPPQDVQAFEALQRFNPNWGRDARIISTAFNRGRLEIAELLIDASPDPSERAKTALLLLADTHDTKEQELSMLHGLLEKYQYDPQTLSHAMALSCWMGKPSFAKALLGKGADFDFILQVDNGAPIGNAVACASGAMNRHLGAACLEVLLEDPRARTSEVLNHGWDQKGTFKSPICEAILAENDECIRALARHGAWVELPPDAPKDCLSPLGHAARWTCQDSLKTLIELGADAMRPTPNGTALHELIEGLSGEANEELLAQHCQGCIEDLVKAGCDPTAVNAQGKTPGELALEKGHPAIAAVFDRLVIDRKIEPAKSPSRILRI